MPQENQDANIEQESSTAQDANGDESSTSKNGAKPESTMSEVLAQTLEKSLKANAKPEKSDEHTEEELAPIIGEDGKEKTAGEKDEKKPEGDESQDESIEEGDEEQESEEDKAKRVAEEARFDKHPRFVELNERVKALEPDANFGRAIANYAREKRIPAETLDQALQLCDLVVNNPAKFVETISPIVDGFKKNMGQGELPADLKAAVENGEINEAWARKEARHRFDRDFGARTTEQQQAQARVDAYKNSMNSWVADKSKVDPAYKPKSNADAADGLFEITEAKFALLASQNPPKSPAEAVKLAEQAYGQAKKMFTTRLTLPPIKRKTFRPVGGNRNGGTAQKAPSTLAEQLEQTMARHTE